MPIRIPWPKATYAIELAPDEAHVWAVPLVERELAYDEFLLTLSSDERDRAREFQLDEPKRRFVIARCALRKLLGQYLGIDPTHVEFASNPGGKPRLAEKHSATGLRFNISHSGDLALIAVAAGCDVGIDVERLRDVGHMEQIARKFFHPAECTAVLATPASERNAAFFQCWTAKEAVLKALGTGITGSLADFEVPNGDAWDSWIDLPSRQTLESRSQCWLQRLTPADGYLGAVACLETKCIVRSWTFDL